MENHLEVRLGRVALVPIEPVVAGSMDQWTLIYTVGSYGVDEGGTIMLVQRTACDWQPPQFDQPKQSGYTTVTTSGSARLDAQFEKKRYKRPWMSWCLVIDVRDGYLSPGDTVTIVLGDQSKGSPGIRAQTFAESKHEFRVLVDPTNAVVLRRLPSSPTFPIVVGDPIRLVCIAPTEVMVGEKKAIFVKGEDKWGNPTIITGELSLSAEGDAEVGIEGNCIKAKTPGKITLIASTGTLSCRSNPIIALKESPRYSRYWGDLHAQTESTVGTGTEEEYFTFARDVARLDFTSHQGNDFQVTDSDWKHLNSVIKKFNATEKFITFPGYEWSGNTSAGGDHNVIYLKDDPPIYRSSHWQVPEVSEDDQSPAHPIEALYKRLRKNGNAILIPHVGGRYADIRKYFDKDLIPVVEIASCWGIFEWMLWDAFGEGHMVGVVCNSDGHKGRPGAEGPGAGRFGIYGGLTCILAESLSRESIFQALKKRRCYGTTGTRIYLWFDANGHEMGEYVNTSNPLNIQAKVIGTAPVETLQLFEGKNVIHTIRPMAFQNVKGSKRIRISWEGAHIRGRARRATWDGSITLEGTRILKAQTYAFDSPADGITESDSQKLVFKSSTTGDIDGIDLFLEQSQDGALTFNSPLGTCTVKLAELDRQVQSFDFGGLGLKVTIQRYPETLSETQLFLKFTVNPKSGETTPYFVKAIQEDGHMTWCSPIYVRS